MNEEKEINITQIDERVIDKYISIMDRCDDATNVVKQFNNKLFIDGLNIIYGIGKAFLLMILWNALAPASDWLSEIGFVQSCAVYFLPKLILKGEF